MMCFGKGNLPHTDISSLREYINLTYLSKNQIVVNHLKRFHTELHTFFEIY